MIKIGELASTFLASLANGMRNWGNVDQKLVVKPVRVMVLSRQ